LVLLLVADFQSKPNCSSEEKVDLKDIEKISFNRFLIFGLVFQFWHSYLFMFKHIYTIITIHIYSQFH